MIAVLNMDLEPIRLVLANEVERIQVCEDRRRASGALYTVVSLTAPDARRTAASYVAGGAFDANGDFLGSASQGEALHLVFRYGRKIFWPAGKAFWGRTSCAGAPWPKVFWRHVPKPSCRRNWLCCCSTTAA